MPEEFLSTATRQVYFGLSDNSTYNTIDVTHEHKVWTGDETDTETVNHQWVITGLTAGSEHTYYVGFKSSSTGGTPHMSWGGNSSGDSPDIIIKAIALPASIST